MKNILLFLIGCFICVQMNAQTLFHKFIYATKASRVSYSDPQFLITNDNGYLLTQSWPKRINDTLKTVYEILKLDATGSVKAERGIILNSSSQIYACNDGNLVIFGESDNVVNILKAEPSGKIIWSKAYNDGSFLFSAKGVIQNGNNLIIGSDNEDLSTGRYWQYAGLMKLDYTTGNLISYDVYASQTFTPDSSQRMLGLLPNNDGSFIMYGISNNKSPFLMKFSAAGTLLWAKYITLNNLFAGLNGIVQTTDGGYAVCGDINDGTNTLDPIVFKTDANGNVVWCKKYTSQFATPDRNEFFDKILTLPSGSLYVSGEVWDQTKYDNVLLKLDKSGNIIWSKRDSIFYITDFNSFAYNKNTNVITGCGKSYLDTVAPSSSTDLITFDTAGNSCNGMAAITFTKTNYPYTSGNYPLQKSLYANIVTSKYPISAYTLGYTVYNECSNNVMKRSVQQQHFNITLLSNILTGNQLNIKISSDVNTQAEVIIKGSGGQVFTKQSLYIVNSITTKNLSLPGLLAGYYFVQVANATENHSAKFYKN